MNFLWSERCVFFLLYCTKVEFKIVNHLILILADVISVEEGLSVGQVGSRLPHREPRSQAGEKCVGWFWDVVGNVVL